MQIPSRGKLGERQRPYKKKPWEVTSCQNKKGGGYRGGKTTLSKWKPSLEEVKQGRNRRLNISRGNCP